MKKRFIFIFVLTIIVSKVVISAQQEEQVKLTPTVWKDTLLKTLSSEKKLILKNFFNIILEANKAYLAVLQKNEKVLAQVTKLIQERLTFNDTNFDNALISGEEIAEAIWEDRFDKNSDYINAYIAKIDTLQQLIKILE